MSGHQNRRRNFEGNFEDEQGRSWYVVDRETDEAVMGPFGTPGYAETCRDRCDPSLANDPIIVGVGASNNL